MPSENRKSKSITAIMIILLFLAGTLMYGCSTGHQVLKYESRTTSADNIIPGIEPEESGRKIMISVRGKGLEPEEGTPMQKRLMAERAAVIDGYRKLAERLGGLILQANTMAGKNTISQDEVMIEVRAYLRGAQINLVTFESGFATAEMRVYIEPRDSQFRQSSVYIESMKDFGLGALAGAAIGAGAVALAD